VTELATVAYALVLFAVAAICFAGGRQLGREETQAENEHWRDQWLADALTFYATQVSYDRRRHGVRPLRAVRRARLYDFEAETG
jgi:hypothetical protein